MIKKFIIGLISMFAASFLSAQDKDTSIFFRYASTFDQLLPDMYSPFPGALPDTNMQKQFNVDLKNRSVVRNGSYSTITSKGTQTENLYATHYAWDAQGRLVNYHTTEFNDTVPLQRYGINYLIAWKASDANYRFGNTYDSILYQFNRGGVVSTMSYRHHTPDTHILRTVQFLYNSQGRVIVATNMFYGPLIGTFTYQYDNNGMLTRRAFSTSESGFVLCTDTIEYSYQLASNSIMIATHRLKVTGMEKWQTLESKTYYPSTGVIISYTDYNDADTNYIYQNYPEYTVRYEYDDQGRMTGEFFGTTIQPDIFVAKYYYSGYAQPDSVVTSEVTVEPKAKYTRVISRDIRTYDAKGRLQSRVISSYEYGEKKKKKFTVVQTEEYRLNYVWQ